MELPEPRSDGQVYVFTRQAAELIGVAPCTISMWRHRGFLKAQPGSLPRKPVYLWEDVLDAEVKTRRNAIATSGSDKRVRRDYVPPAPETIDL